MSLLSVKQLVALHVSAANCLRASPRGVSTTYIGVELPHKAGEVVVLEVAGQQVPAELWWLPYDEAAGANHTMHVGMHMGSDLHEDCCIGQQLDHCLV
jgi:hypothetical protein